MTVMSGHPQKRKNIHFEIHARRGTSWTILELEYDEKQALKKGEQAWDSGRYIAVKVIRERYDRESATFSSIELFYRGKKRKTSKIDEESRVSACWKPGDFYSYEGRRTIAHLLESTFADWQLTATELIHCPDYYYRLNEAGTLLQNAVQRAAVAQVSDTGQSVQERMKQIFSLIELAVDRVKTDWETGVIGAWREGHFDTLVQKLGNAGDQSYLLTSAIVKDLSKHENLREKLTRIFTLIRADHPKWVLKIVDVFAAELLSQWDTLSDILGERPNHGEQLTAIAKLSQGLLEEATAADQNAVPDDLINLNNFLGKSLLPYCRIALEQQLMTRLKSSRRLCEGTLAEEFSYIAKVIAAMHKADDSMIGGLSIVESAEERCGRLLNSQTIGEHIAAAPDPGKQLSLLLDLEDHVLGAKNKRSLANYIMPILTGQENEAYFCATDGKYMERMPEISKLQRRILKSDFQEMHKRKLAEVLDDFCTGILTRSDLFTRIDKSGKHITEKSQGLLQMIKAGYFTEGKALSAAKSKVQTFIKNPAFVKAVSAGASDGAEKSRALMEFKELLRQTGMAEMV